MWDNTCEQNTNNDSMDMSLGELWELVMDRETSSAVIHGVAKNRTWRSDWTELNGTAKWHTIWKNLGKWCDSPGSQRHYLQ